MHSAQNFGANNFVMMTFFGIGGNFWIFHEKGRRESSEALDHCILHGISVRIQPRGRFFASSHPGKLDFSCFSADFKLIPQTMLAFEGFLLLF